MGQRLMDTLGLAPAIDRISQKQVLSSHLSSSLTPLLDEYC